MSETRTITMLLQVPADMPLARVLSRMVHAKRAAVEDCHECVHNCVEQPEGDTHEKRLDDLDSIAIVGIVESEGD